jgi:UDP-glucuronate 4-epimerase
MPRVLITGAAGFIGMHTSIRFLKEGWDVVGLDNLNDYYSVSLKRNRLKEISKVGSRLGCTFQMFETDINSSVWNDLESVDFDAIVHLAAQAGVRYSIENPRAYLESNVFGFQKVLDYVKKTQVKRFVYASSSSVYGKDSKQPFNENEACNNPESYYAATKKMNEHMAKSYFNTHNVSSIGLRFFTVYGPWGRPDMAPMLFTKAAYDNEPIKVYNYGNQSRDFTYIDDIVEGIFSLIAMVEFPKFAEVCNIGNGSPVGLMNFIEQIEANTSSILKKDFVDAQKGDVAQTYADTTKLFKLTGYKPKTSLETGIEKFINWYKVYNKL